MRDLHTESGCTPLISEDYFSTAHPVARVLEPSRTQGHTLANAPLPPGTPYRGDMSEIAPALGQPRGHLFTKNEAAKACNVDPSTIKRRLSRGTFPHAYQDADNIWRIPYQDLVDAGLRPGAPTEPVHAPEVTPGHAPPQLEANTLPAPIVPLPLDSYRKLIEAQQERDDLRQQLAQAQQDAHRWYEQAQWVQRQLPADPAETIVDVREEQPPAKRRRLFRKNI